MSETEVGLVPMMFIRETGDLVPRNKVDSNMPIIPSATDGWSENAADGEGADRTKRARIYPTLKTTFTQRRRNEPMTGISATGGDPGWIRTSDLQLRRLLLYPLSYGAATGGL